MSFRANLLALSLIAASAAVMAPATASAPTERPAQKPALKVLDWQVAFSPNGDGRKDVARIRYSLGGPAQVSVEVLKGRRVIRREALGRRTAGPHVFTWDGRNGAERKMADSNHYLVRLRARAYGRVTRKSTSVSLDTDGSGDLITSRRAVYPTATIVKDAVELVFVYADWDAEDYLYTNRIQERSRLRIINDAGKVVWKDSSRGDAAPTFVWRAQTKSGRPVPTGTYRAKFFTVDESGNPFRTTRRLTVSHDQLVEQTSSWTVNADVPAEYIPASDGCNDCNYYASPVPSDRFPEGLSFRPTDFPAGSARHMSLPAPVVPAPVDTYRVSATGGPTTVGSADIGQLSAPGSYPKTKVGDSTTSTKWVKVYLKYDPYLPDGLNPVDFGFNTDGTASYDVATFTIDYRYYVPAGG